ncbi:MAG: dUTP diphosphatase [Candidatus Magasanikbacteria bacterium]
MKVKVKKLKGEAKIPSFAHEGDAGMDIYSTEDKVITPKNRETIELGFAMQFPSDYMVIFKDRSSLASEYGVHTLAGVIDSGYRGEYKAVLVNLGDESFEVETGQKVGQMLFLPRPEIEVEQVEELSDSIRGEGGFGSTGKF